MLCVCGKAKQKVVVYEKILEMVMGSTGSNVHCSCGCTQYCNGNAQPPLSLGRRTVSGAASGSFFVQHLGCFINASFGAAGKAAGFHAVTGIHYLAVITGIVFIFIKAPKHQALYRGALVSIAMTSLATFGLIHFSIQADATSTSFANLANAYRNYGFAYCFATSLLDTGISKP